MADDPKFTIEPRPGVTVYVNSAGTITLRQIGGVEHEDDEPIIVLHPDDVPRLTTMLNRLRDESYEALLSKEPALPIPAPAPPPVTAHDDLPTDETDDVPDRMRN